MSFDFSDPAFVASLQGVGGGGGLPSSPLWLWRPSQLALAVNDPITVLPDEGSYGWDLAPTGVGPPVYDEVDGIPCVSYSVGGRATVNVSLGYFQSSPYVSEPEVTGLFIVRPISASPASPYAAGTGQGGSSFRLDFARSFAYRGAILPHPTGTGITLGSWHYAVVHYNGANTTINLDGLVGAPGNVGGSTTLRGYYLGAFGTASTNRWTGYIADVGFWSGDRTAEVEAYARSVLGLP